MINHIKELTGSDVKGTLKSIQSIAFSHGLPTTYQNQKIKKGWMNAPKGMMQILHERGFLDPEKDVSFHAINGKKIGRQTQLLKDLT